MRKSAEWVVDAAHKSQTKQSRRATAHGNAHFGWRRLWQSEKHCGALGRGGPWMHAPSPQAHGVRNSYWHQYARPLVQIYKYCHLQ